MRAAERHDRRRGLEDALSAIPVFPLPQMVLFPEGILPLHVFEPRYRAMLRHCLRTHGAMVVAQSLGGHDAHGRPRIARIAGGAIVIEHQPLPDGRANIVLLGEARLRLDELEPDPSRSFRVARATLLEDLPRPIPEGERAALVAAVTMFAAEVKRHDPRFTFRTPATLEAARVADLCAYQLVVDAGARQSILDELDPRVRVRMVIDQLATQHVAMMSTHCGGATQPS